jgi:hypothetical protein
MAKRLVSRLERFMETWISNPAAQLDFIRLIEAVHEQPRADHANQPLLDWIDKERRGLRSIGFK